MEQINVRWIFSAATGFIQHGGFGADTGEVAWALFIERRWTVEDYRSCVELLRQQ